MSFYSSSRRSIQRDLFVSLDSDISGGNTFLAKCSNISADVIISARDTREGFEGRTLLHAACKNGNLNAVGFLIKLGHPLDVVDSSCSLVTPLMEAVSLNYIDIACALVQGGADLFRQDVRLENIMHYCARVGSRIIIKLIQSSKLPKEKIQALTTTANIKNFFPEDVARNELVKEVLIDYRETGRHFPKSKKPFENTVKSFMENNAERRGSQQINFNYQFSSDSDDGKSDAYISL